MQKLLFISLILFISISVSAQNFANKKFYLVDSLVYENLSETDKRLIDSSLNVFHKAKTDTSKIHAVNKIVDQSWDDQVWPKYNSWIYSYVKKCLTKKNDAKTEKRLKIFLSTALNNCGVVALNKGKIDESLDFFHQSMEIEKQITGDKNIATSLSNLAFIYSNQGDIPKALEYYHDALKIQEKYHDSVGISRSFNNIGFIYQNLGDNKKALEYYEKSLAIREKTNDKMGIAVSLSNIAEIYDENKDYKSAIEYYIKSNQIYESIGNQQGLAGGMNNVAYIYLMYGVPDCHFSREECMQEGRKIAFEYCQKSLKIQEKNGDKSGMISSLHNLAKIHLMNNELSLAKVKAEKAYSLSKELAFPENIRKAASLMKEISFRNGNYKAAYDYFLEEIQMRDSLEKKDNYKLAQQKQAKYFYDKIHESDSIAFAEQKKALAEKQKMRDEKQKTELKLKENQQIFLFAGVGALIIFTGFLYNRFKITSKQKKIIEHQKLLVEEKNKEVLDSINYAKRIQDAILPSRESLNKHLKNGFVLYIPKDIVAGDFYWMEKIGDYTFIAVADCTGHGVPGAMVSVICCGALNRAVKEFNLTDPGKILDKVRDLVIDTFSKSENEVQDGMDISLCCFYHPNGEINFSDGNNKSKLYWAGANNPLWIIRKKNGVESSQNAFDEKNKFNGNYMLTEVKANKQPVGKYLDHEPFTTHSIEIFKNDLIFLFSDGYTDQFGGDKGKKFKYSNLQKLILESANQSPDSIHEKLQIEFDKWKGDLEQVDDICVIGVKL